MTGRGGAGARGVVQAAAGVRLGLLGLLGLAAGAFPDFDESAGLPQATCRGFGAARAAVGAGALGPAERALRALAVWDAVYFVRVCECGYEQERFFAFFPGLPLAMRGLARPLAVMLPALSLRATCSLAGLLLSFAACVAAAAGLYRLGEVLLRDAGAARRAALLFCVNPASPFYSAAYTEATFAALTFWGLYFLFRPGEGRVTSFPSKLRRATTGDEARAVVLFMAAAAVRSNGALLWAFLAARRLHGFVVLPALQVGRSALVLATEAALVLLPSVAFQVYGYTQLCSAGVEEPRPWCTEGRLPSVYTFVQKEYWEVGLFRYWQAKQVPNFLLAAPALVLAALGTVHYLRRIPPAECARFWLLGRRTPGRPARGTLFTPEMAPFVLHWALLAAVALLVMNIQVATRFLSACPALYWFVDTLRGQNRRWAFTFFLTYALVGALAFANFYPWT